MRFDRKRIARTSDLGCCIPVHLSGWKMPCARFLLTGPYSQIWIAFNPIFKTLADSKVELRPEFCIEHYLSDPKVTHEEKLQTELLVPLA